MAPALPASPLLGQPKDKPAFHHIQPTARAQQVVPQGAQMLVLSLRDQAEEAAAPRRLGRSWVAEGPGTEGPGTVWAPTHTSQSLLWGLCRHLPQEGSEASHPGLQVLVSLRT